MSGRYRKRPIVIDAVQWTGDNLDEIHAMPGGDMAGISTETPRPGPRNLEVRTLEGVMLARPGDWIIRGVSGEFYPCQPDIFAKTYEPVPEGE